MNSDSDQATALVDEPPMKVRLLGGAHCGGDWQLSAHCHRIDLPDGTHYAFCPHATALQGRDTFLHSSLDHFLCAR